MLRLVIFVLAALSSSIAQNGDPPASPCPAVFSYNYSPSQSWHGIITIVPPLTFSEVQLVLRLAVALYRPDSGVGSVEVLGGRTEVQNIANRASVSQRQRIQYIVNFPPYQEFPRISSVKINGYEFCSAPVSNDARGVIELKYTLKTGLGLPIANGNEFSVEGGSIVQSHQPTQQWQQPQQPTQQQWTQQPHWQQQPTQRPQWQQQTPAPQQPERPVEQVEVVASLTTQDPNEAYFELINSVTQPPARPSRPRPSPKPTPRPTASTTSDEYDYPEEEEYDFKVEYEVNSLDCGIPAVPPVNTLVVKGENTRKGEWPWMAAIYLASDKTFRCAGSLISRRHVVTAAHCVTEPSTRRPMTATSFIIRLGRYNLDSKAEEDEQIIIIDEITINPKYTRSKKQDHDISLIVLKTAAIINDYVRTVCFWDEILDTRIDNLVHEVGLAPGWGKDERGVMAKDMKLARMPVVSQSDCVASDTEFYSAIISDKTFCAGFTNGTTLCNGDSGGGLYFYQKNPKTQKMAWFVRGIVSLSKLNSALSTCGERNYVVFTDIAAVLKWISPKLQAPESPPFK